VKTTNLTSSILSPSAPIGIFDSGVGGLSVYQAVRHAFPAEDIIYIADSGYAPYGDRSSDFITERAVAMTGFLVAAGAKAVVVACNTATVIAVEQLRRQFSIPIIALEPAIKPAIEHSRSGAIGVLATRKTIESPAVERLCRTHGANTRVLLQPCPGFVEQVERGEMEHPKTYELIRRYVEPLLASGADTLVLGCTHYVYLAQQIRAIVGPDVTILDSSAAVARQVGRRIGSSSVAASDGRSIEDQFFTTAASTDHARTVMSTLLGRAVDVRSAQSPSPAWSCTQAALP
jgi:glutamate racemase